MRKYFLILLLLVSAAGFSQTTPNIIYGKEVVIQTRDTSSAELTIKNSTRNVLGYFKNIGGGKGQYVIIPQTDITGLPDSLLARYTKAQADSRFKTINYVPAWIEITDKPANFSTTHALSNDIQDSLLNKVSRDGSYANPSWITSLDYSKLTGTVPTWNQNTTGNAATVTNGVYTTGSYANPSWITELAWSKVSGAPAFITGINSSMVTTALGYTPENLANKGVANGYADLDASGKIPASRIDFGQTGQTFVVASQAAMLAVSGANVGALAIRTDQNKNYRLIAQPASTLANWQVLLSPDAPVQSVNGFTGNVNLLTTHISEGSNYWWTAARSRAAQSLTTSGSSGAATYDNTTGVLNIPTYTLAGLGGQPALSGTGFVKISGTTITYDNSTYLTSYTETDPTIYAWAKATTKPSYSWGEITGTVPTWNQNTTGNAATVTNGVYTTGSYANPSWITSLDYSKLTGTVPTWNQNTTGNAATATTTNNWGGNTLGGASSSTPNYLFGAYAGGNAYYSDQTAVRAFLALGSYAYRSSGLAELSGATFTGGIGGTTAIFSGGVSANTSFSFGGLTSGSTIFVVDNKYQHIRFAVESDLAVIRTDWYSGAGGAQRDLVLQYGLSDRIRLNSTGIAVSGSSLFNSSISSDNGGNSFNFLAQSINIGTIGNWVGYAYGYSGSSYIKGATIYESLDASGRGRFHIALNGGNNSSNVTLSDSKFNIDYTGVATFNNTVNSRTFTRLYTTGGTSSVPVYENALTYNAGDNSYGAIQFSNQYTSNTFTGFRLRLTGSGGTFNALAISPSGEAMFNGSGNTLINLTSSSTNTRINFSHSGNGGLVGYANLGAGAQSNVFYITTGDGNIGSGLTIDNNGAAAIASTTTSTGFIKSGSSDSYFLLGGGGHVATSTYATTESLSGYVDISSNQYEIGGNKTFLADVVVNGKLTGARILGSTASYTTTATISSTITTAFCSGSGYTLTLPSASGVTGQILTVISNSSLTGITLSGVEGGSFTLICNHSLVLVSNGTTWKIASSYQNSAACS